MSCLLIYQVKHRKQGGPGQEARAREIAGERGGRKRGGGREERIDGEAEDRSLQLFDVMLHPPTHRFRFALSSYARRYNAQCENQNPARVNGEPEVEVNVAEVVCSNHLSTRL